MVDDHGLTIQRVTESRANQRATANASAAPRVEAMLTETTPSTRPNMDPAAMVSTDAGTAATTATAYRATKTTGPHQMRGTPIEGLRMSLLKTEPDRGDWTCEIEFFGVRCGQPSLRDYD
jgi:hypothetical protein